MKFDQFLNNDKINKERFILFQSQMNELIKRLKNLEFEKN